MLARVQFKYENKKRTRESDQIIVSISWTLSVTFPEPFSSMLKWLNFVELDFLSLDCLDVK